MTQSPPPKIQTESVNSVEKEQASKPKQRDSNLELFRIISMLLIVAHHFVANSGLTAANGVVFSNILSWRSQFLLIFGAWGKIGINCFVLITGYFMCKSNITLKKFVKLFAEVMFYNIIIGTIFFATGYTKVSFTAIVKVLLPITSISNGFTGCYLVFFLCIPFLNILIKHLSEKQHIYLLILCSFIYIVFGTIPKLYVTMNYVSWFIVLYFISSYIRLYPKKIFSKTTFWGIMSIVSVLLCVASVVLCSWVGTKIGKTFPFRFVTDSNTLLAVITGICFFLFFKNLKIKTNPFINTVASATFGVLLIHANSDAMRQWLWKDLLNTVSMYDNKLMPLHVIGCVLAIFAACVIIDLLRKKLIEEPIFKKLDRPMEKLKEKWHLFENKIFSTSATTTDEEIKEKS